jgi:hypothetical protein
VNDKSDIRAEIIEDLAEIFATPVYRKAVADALMADKIRHVKVILEIECPGPDAQKVRIAALEKALNQLCDAVLACDLEPELDEEYQTARALLREGNAQPGYAEARTPQAVVCSEVLAIMETYREQSKSAYGVGTPGGLEHMGDVWSLFFKWERMLTEPQQPDDADTLAMKESQAAERDAHLGDVDDVAEDRMGYR